MSDGSIIEPSGYSGAVTEQAVVNPSTTEPTPESLLGIPALRALARLARVLERSCDEMSLAHYRVLAAVDAGEERASRLAARLALGKPAVSAAVEALHDRGFLARSTTAGDQRVSSLSLTPEGRAALSRVEARMGSKLVELCARTGQSRDVQTALVALGVALETERQERSRDSRRPDGLAPTQL
jgi:DNA-binding MarR family transcriptional regulator